MTWSVVHTASYTNLAYNLAAQSAPFRYHFETFLPSRGWTINRADGTEGFTWLDPATEDAWKCEKQFTNFDGTTTDIYAVYECEYAQNDVAVRKSVDNTWATLTSGWSTGSFAGYQIGDKTAYWLGSDENDDAWIFILGGQLVGASFGIDGYWYAPGWGEYPALLSDGSPTLQTGHILQTGFPTNVWPSPAYLMTNMWMLGISSTSNTLGNNRLSDTYFRINGSGTTGASIAQAAAGAASVLVDGRYYLDLNPSNALGLMLDMDQTDLGILAI